MGLNVQNLRLQVGSFVSSDGGRNYRARNTTGTTQSSLGRNENVRNVLVFTQERKMKENFQGLSISYKRRSAFLVQIYFRSW